MKTITIQTLSILLAAVLLVAALPVTAFADDVSLCTIIGHSHIYEEYIWEENEFYSVDVHRVIIHITERCTVCGILSDDEVLRYSLAVHDAVIVSSGVQYEYLSNEYHNKIDCSCKIFACCDNTTLIEPDYNTAVPLCHTIDPSVDQEYEMEGTCVDCGETIYW